MKNLERDLFSLIALVSNVTDAYSACLFLENKRQGLFQLTSYHSLSPHIIPDATVESGQGFLGWVLENNEPLSVNQFDKDTIVLGYYSRNEDIKSFMATPIPAGRTQGALAVDSKKSWFFTPKCQKILAGFAQQFAHLADSALAMAQNERRQVDLFALGSYIETLRSCESEDQLLNAICLVPQEVLSFDGCFLVLVDAEAHAGRLVRTSGFGELFLENLTVSERSTLVGYVLGKGEPLRLPDLRGKRGRRPILHPSEPLFDARSAAAVPLIAGGRTIGALGFTARRPGRFGTSALKRAELLAAPVADALERLRAQRKWREREEWDSLTGGRNLLFLRARLGEMLRDAGLRGRRLSLLCLAPDDLHERTEGAGLEMEEELILHIHSLMQPFSRGGDILVRQEGTRYLLLLRDSSEEYAEAVAEAVIQAANENPLAHRGREIPITVSVGIASFPEDGEEAEPLIAGAIRALGSARSEGINQLCLHGRP